jgi:gentisate 1,2-dioxygenase
MSAAQPRRQFGSADFGSVPAALKPDAWADSLVHQNVLEANPVADVQLSQHREHLVRVVDLPSRVLSMTLGGLKPGQGTRMHRHNYETILYILRGRGVSTIGDRQVPWRAGDAVYVPVWAWHSHRNISESEDALYVAAENAPMLQNLGIALREER